MKITTSDSNPTVTRHFAITEDNPVVPFFYARPPKGVVVEKGAIKYTLIGDRWIVDGTWAVSVVGAVLKKDGSRSKNTHQRHPQEADGTYREPELVLHEDWKWLQPVIDLLRPQGDVTLPEVEGTIHPDPTA